MKFIWVNEKPLGAKPRGFVNSLASDENYLLTLKLLALESALHLHGTNSHGVLL